MENGRIDQFSFNYKGIAFEEIALEGLEGIGIDLLWKRMDIRLGRPVSLCFRNRIWDFIRSCDDITLYKLPEPRATIEVLDRFSLIDEKSGNIVDPPEYLDGPYEYSPVKNDYGSCQHYKTRREVPREDYASVSLTEICDTYGSHLVLVASLEERWNALAPHLPINYLDTMTQLHYCFLELIGKSRRNGQTTTGTTNLSKMVKDPKYLFYYRNFLAKLDLVKTNFITEILPDRTRKAIVVRLKRYSETPLWVPPKRGKVADLVNYLKTKTYLSEDIGYLIKEKKLLDRVPKNKIRRLVNILQYKTEEMPAQEPKKKKRKVDSDDVKPVKYFQVTTAHLNMDTEDAELVEEVTNEESVPCQYKVGVSLFRQAYERLLDSGRKGLTISELSATVGCSFFTCRTICRTFKNRNIIREYYEDRGKQRLARLVATASKGDEEEYANEKQKLLTYISNSKIIANPEHEPPTKKKRLENEEGNIQMVTNVIVGCKGQPVTNTVTEQLNSNVSLTLRQMRYINGLMKIMQDRQAVQSLHVLCKMIAKDINDIQMDNRPFQRIVQRLVNEGCLKVYKLKWPTQPSKWTIVVCSPDISSPDHPTILKKYEDFCVRAYSVQPAKPTLAKVEPTVQTKGKDKPLSLFSYQKFMRVKKLHEFLFSLLYGHEGDDTYDADLPPGFFSLVTIMPEMTVKLAVGLLSSLAIYSISTLKITEKILNLKLKDAPHNVYKILLQSKGLQASLRTNLTILTSFGLLQICNPVKPMNATHTLGMMKYIFYVNRNAKLIDTTGTWPRQDADLAALEKRFHFNNMEDIAKYWKAVFDISINTEVENRMKSKVLPTVPVRSQNDVLEHDTGKIFGNGDGPCGMDSVFYLEVSHHWQSSNIVKCLHTEKVKKVHPQLVKTKKKRMPPKKVKPKKNLFEVKPRPQSTEKKGIPKHRKPKIPWTEWDDHVINLCKAASTILFPAHHPASYVVRNSLAKSIIDHVKKDGNACHKRCSTVEKNNTFTLERDGLINELKRRPTIWFKYQELSKKFMLGKYVSTNDIYVAEIKLEMLGLVKIILELWRSKAYKNRTASIAKDMEEFSEKFNIVTLDSQKPYNAYKDKADDKDEAGTLVEAIMMAVAQSLNREVDLEESLKVYACLSSFSDSTLRACINNLRKWGWITAKEKLMNNHLQRFTFHDLMRASSTFRMAVSTFRVSKYYLRRQLGQLNEEFADDVANHVDNELPASFKSTQDINCFVFEMQGRGALDVVTAVPPCIVSGMVTNKEIDSTEHQFKLKTGTLTCVKRAGLERYSDVFEVPDFDALFKAIVSEAIVGEPKIEVDIESDSIISFINETRESGCTFKELREHCAIDLPTLIKKLQHFEENHIIKSVGFYTNRVVLTKYAPHITLDGNRIIPAPWLRINMEINREFFIQWCGPVLKKIFEKPGLSISSLEKNFDCISQRSLQDICYFLSCLKCIEMKVVNRPDPGLFSDDDAEIEILDYNKYASFDAIIIFALTDALTRYSYYRKLMLKTCIGAADGRNI